MFDNVQVLPGDLPRLDDLAWQPVEARFARRQIASVLLVHVVVAASLAVFQAFMEMVFRESGREMGFGWIWLPFLPVVVVTAVWPLLSVPRMGYAIRDRDIAYRCGVVWHTITAIPLNRIQHVEKFSSPLDRRFGLANLKIYTAGGSGGDLKLHGLAAGVAENLRGYILDRVGDAIER